MTSWWLGEEPFPRLLHRLGWKYHLCDGMWKFSKHKNIRNKPKATGACSNAPGTETVILDFIQMSYAMRDLYIFHVHYSCCLDSQKIYDRENTLLTRTEGKKKKICDAGSSLWAHLKTAFSVFPALYSILVRVMWFFTLLNVRGISTVAAHI